MATISFDVSSTASWTGAGCDVVKVVARGDDCADHEQKQLPQRNGDSTLLARVVNLCEMVQKRAEAGLRGPKASMAGLPSFEEQSMNHIL